MASELTLLAPVMILLLLFVVFCGRLADARLRVNDAAHQAVRSATLARSNAQAATDAQTTTEAALSQAGLTCRNLNVTANTGGFQPGSAVVVGVHCEIGLSDLSLLAVPGSAAVNASASSVVDQFRGSGGAGS